MISTYFPNLEKNQIARFESIMTSYKKWNEKINVISRKNMDALEEQHILHSLSLFQFLEGNEAMDILDVGCGGGFPGIPLSILFPKSRVMLIDSIGKKIKVVNEVAEEAGLTNAKGFQLRAEDVEHEFDVIVSRAVAPLYKLIQWNVSNLKEDGSFLFLKGGDLEDEISEAKKLFPGLDFSVHPISDQFIEPFFETKSVIQASLKDWVLQEPA